MLCCMDGLPKRSQKQLDLPHGEFPMQGQFSAIAGASFFLCVLILVWGVPWAGHRHGSAVGEPCYALLTLSSCLLWAAERRGRRRVGRKSPWAEAAGAHKKRPSTKFCVPDLMPDSQSSQNPLILLPAELSCLSFLPLIISSVLTYILQFSGFVSCSYKDL